MELLIESTLLIGADEFYRSSRYNLPLVVMLVNSTNNKAFDILEESIRQTDVIQQLTSDTTVVFLSHTNYKESELFVQKIKEKFDFTSTISEFKKEENTFLKTLFLENENKVETI